MENVTLNQKEQARLQILNSLLTEHMTVDQAATLMGVSTRHTRRRTDAGEKPTRTLPEYLEHHEVEALIRAAPNPRARILFLIEWRAGLRVSEALALEARDLSLDGELPSLRVHRGKAQEHESCPYIPSFGTRWSVRCSSATSPVSAETAAMLGADYWQHMAKEHGRNRSVSVRHVRTG